MNCVSTIFDSTSLSDLDFTRGKEKTREVFERYCTWVKPLKKKTKTFKMCRIEYENV